MARLRKLPPAGTRLTASDLWHTGTGLLFSRHAEQRLTQTLKENFFVRYCYTVNSGRAALTIILKALTDGDSRNEVILPGYACFSVAASVKRAGLRARLADFALGTAEYDAAALERAITPQTLAIVAIYPFNLTIDIDALRSIAHKRNVWLIEDAAQAMGLKIGGRWAGTIGDVGFFSLSKGKAITSITGGIIVTNNDKISAKINAQMAHIPPAGAFEILSVLIQAKAMWLLFNPNRYWLLDHLPGIKLGETVYNPDFALTRMPKAAVILAQRLTTRLGDISRRRAERAQRLLLAVNCQPSLTPVMGHLPKDSLFLRLPLVCSTPEQRDMLFAQLRQFGASTMYGDVLGAIADVELFCGDTEHLPNARRFARTLLTLPTHDYVTEKDIAAIATRLGTATIPATSRHD